MGGGIMETGRSTAVGLSLFFYLLAHTRISNAGHRGNNAEGIILEEIVLARNGNATKLIGVAAIENPSEPGEQILSLINGTSDLVFPNYDPLRDQSLARSDAVIVSLDDPENLENLDHALAFSEYESRKLDTRKDKRKIFEDVGKDAATLDGQARHADSTLLPYVKTSYDVPRGFQPTKPNFYQERQFSTPRSHRKLLKPVDQVNSGVANTEVPIQRYTIGYRATPKIDKQEVSPRIYKEEGFTLNPLGVQRSTYRVPIRKAKHDELKIKENIPNVDALAEIHPKPKKSKRKNIQKNLNVSPAALVATPLPVYNYTIARRKIGDHAPSIQTSTIRPVNVEKINNIAYRDTVDAGHGLLKKYDINPRPFSYSINHAKSDARAVPDRTRNTPAVPVNSKSNFEIKESSNAGDLRSDPITAYKDNPELYGNLQNNDYKDYKHERRGSIDKERIDDSNASNESDDDEKSSLKTDLISEESDESNEDVEESIERPQRRNDSYEVSEAASLEEDSDPGYSDSYKQVEDLKNDEYRDNDKRRVRQSHDSKRDDEGNDENHDADYEKTERGVDRSSEEYRVKENVDNGGPNEEADDGGEKKFEKGGAVEREENHYQRHGQKGEKAYESWHEHDEADKGHHDKEKHSKEYDEKDGEKKEREEEGGYHEEYRRGEKGKKEAEFDEKGEHKKGHATKGEHSVHKKDEYEKKTEFFDEYHEDGDAEKDGEYYNEREAEHGGKTRSGHRDEADEEEKHGKLKKYEESEYLKERKGKNDEEGQESRYDREERYGKKGAHESGKKWMMEHGDDGGENGGHAGSSGNENAGDKH